MTYYSGKVAQTVFLCGNCTREYPNRAISSVNAKVNDWLWWHFDEVIKSAKVEVFRDLHMQSDSEDCSEIFNKIAESYNKISTSISFLKTIQKPDGDFEGKVQNWAFLDSTRSYWDGNQLALWDY